MGTNLNRDLVDRKINSFVVYDLEFVGDCRDTLKNCYIYNIAGVNLINGTSFNKYITLTMKKIPDPVNEFLPVITHKMLKEKKAEEFKIVLKKFMEWLPENPILISHNNFRSDKPLLEIEAKRHGLNIPLNWYFFDSLIYLRNAIPKLSSYTLNSIYNSLFGSDVNKIHEALYDCYALREILIKNGIFSIYGPMYPPYSTPLQCIKGIGTASENIFFRNHIHSVNELITVFHRNYTLQNLRIPIRLKMFIINTLIMFGFSEHQLEKLCESIMNWMNKLVSI